MKKRIIARKLKKARLFAKNAIWLSPQNLESEREKFFNSRVYEPKLKYPKVPQKAMLSLIKTIERLAENTTVINDPYLTNKVHETNLKLRLISAIGNPAQITEISEKQYLCTFAPNYISQAGKDVSRSNRFVAQELYSPKETKKLFEEYLFKNGITNWQVTVSRQTDFYIQVRASRKLIRIGKNINWDFATLDTTFAHEIDAHVFRAVNAGKQKGLKYKHIYPFYIKTEEGLACFLGDYCADGGKLSLKHHALKYLAGFVALSNSFRETYNFLMDNGFTEGLAFQRAFRLKRGIIDTASPGCYAREAVYYEGLVDVKKYVDNGGNLKALFAGKIPLEETENIPIPANLLVPRRIIYYQKKKQASKASNAALSLAG